MALEDPVVIVDETVEANVKSISDEKMINEEYKVWKKNSPFLYDLVVTHALMWPTLTVQWFPDIQETPDARIHRMLVGTHTSPGTQNHLQIVQVTLPTDQALEAAQADQSGAEYVGGKDCKITTIQKIKHEGEILSTKSKCNRDENCPRTSLYI